jgi:hypothetical protein
MEMAGRKEEIMSLFGKCLVVAVVGMMMLPADAEADPIDLLMKLDGTWEVDVGSGKKATCEGKRIAGGKGIYTFFKRPVDKGTYEAHAIWTYDNETKKIFVYELNSHGEVFEHVGSFKKDGSLHLVRKKRRGKRVVVQKTVMTWKSGDEIVSKIDEKVKGKWESYTFTFKKTAGG